MKYAFMTFSCPELDFSGVLDVARRIGYDGVEPRIDAGHKHGIDVGIGAADRAEIRRTVAAGDVALACIATSCVFADPEKTDENVEKCLRAIDLAGDLGCPTIRVFGGQIAEGMERDEAIDLVARSLTEVAGLAVERGVTVCVETHDDWCAPAHLAAVMERVDSPGVAINWDIMHPVRTRSATMDEAFEALRRWIRHVHFHDARVDEHGNPTLDFVSIGTGYVDHKTAIERLRSIGYGGFLSGEWINWSDPYESHLPRELEIVRGYES